MAENNNISLHASKDTQLSDLKQTKKKSEKVKKENVVIVITFILLLIFYFFSVAIFSVPDRDSFTLANLIRLWGEKFSSFLNLLAGNTNGYSYGNIVKYTIIVLAGAALASSGAVFQGSFKNIIASPTTMGVQAGATLGNALYLLIFTTIYSGTLVIRPDGAVSNPSFFELNMQQICAMLGSFIAIFVVIRIATTLGRGNFNAANILFSGFVFSSFVGAITSIIQTYFLYNDANNTRFQSMMTFSMGSFERVISLYHLAFVSVFLLPCLAILIAISSKLNVLVMGEDEAKTMGLNVTRYRNILIAIGTLMSATVFAFCGQIGFVGFIVPQIARRLVGPDFKRLIVMTIALGGLFMILVYNIAFAFGLVGYINIIVSVVGCIMMIVTLLRGKGGSISYE